MEGKLINTVFRPALLRGNPSLKLRVISRPVMKFDPIYLSEEASLGVLSVDGNFCTRILSAKYAKVKESRA